MHDGDELIREALHAGARGYLLKSEGDEQIISAVAALASHRPFFSAQASEALLDSFSQGSGAPANVLTMREREIVQLIAEGNSNKTMARFRSISVSRPSKRIGRPRCVNSGMHSSAELVAFMRCGTS